MGRNGRKQIGTGKIEKRKKENVRLVTKEKGYENGVDWRTGKGESFLELLLVLQASQNRPSQALTVPFLCFIHISSTM